MLASVYSYRVMVKSASCCCACVETGLCQIQSHAKLNNTGTERTAMDGTFNGYVVNDKSYPLIMYRGDTKDCLDM